MFIEQIEGGLRVTGLEMIASLTCSATTKTVKRQVSCLLVRVDGDAVVHKTELNPSSEETSVILQGLVQADHVRLGGGGMAEQMDPELDATATVRVVIPVAAVGGTVDAWAPEETPEICRCPSPMFCREGLHDDDAWEEANIAGHTTDDPFPADTTWLVLEATAEFRDPMRDSLGQNADERNTKTPCVARFDDEKFDLVFWTLARNDRTY